MTEYIDINFIKNKYGLNINKYSIENLKNNMYITTLNNKLIDNNIFNETEDLNFNFRLYTLRDIVCGFMNKYIITSNFMYINKLIDLINIFIQKFNTPKKNQVWGDHAIAWRLITLHMLHYILYNFKYLKINDNFLVNIIKYIEINYNYLLTIKYNPNNHGLYVDLSLLMVSPLLNKNLPEVEKRLKMNLNRLISINEGLCKEHSINYHRLYASLISIFHYNNILNDITEKYLNNFNNNIDYFFINEKSYTLIGDTDIHPLEHESYILDNKVASKKDYIVFKETGFGIIKDKNIYFCITNNYFSNYHKHFDFCSFELYLNKVPIFVDSGRYSYNSNDPIRKHVISSYGHSTFGIKNKKGYLNSNFFNAGSIEILKNSNNYTVTCINPYNEKYLVYHTRKIIINLNRVKIIDIIKNESKNDVDIELTFNLHPNIKFDNLNCNFKNIDKFSIRDGYYCPKANISIKNKFFLLEKNIKSNSQYNIFSEFNF